MRSLKDQIKRLLCVDDTPQRTALAFSIGVFLGFSPFLGVHTLAAIAVAFLFRLNRVAILLGAWSNTPWWIIPYYGTATWVGMKMVGCRVNNEALIKFFRSGQGMGSIGECWSQLSTQWNLLLSFGVGSFVLALLLSLAVYPLTLKWIKFYRSKRCPPG